MSHGDALRESMAAADSGQLGAYSACSFTVVGTGRFTPQSGARPFIGAVGVPEQVIEERIEVTCLRSSARAIVAAARAVHPYEEAVFDVYVMVDLDNE